MSDGETTFWALVALEGAAYTAARSSALDAASVTRGSLLLHAKSGDARECIQAKILLGWMDHRATYDELLAMLDAEDPGASSRTLVGIAGVWNKYVRLAETRYRASILPLCWEAVTKHASDWPAFKLVAFLRMMLVVPDPGSMEPLLAFLETARSDSIAHDAARSLSVLPRDFVEARIALAQKKNQAVGARLAEVLREARRPPPSDDD